MKDAFILLLTVLTFIQSFAVCVDNVAQPSLREAFKAYLNRPFDKKADAQTEDSYRLTVRSFEAVLDNKFLSLTFFSRSLLVSLAFISIFSLYKCWWDAQYLGLVRSVLFSPSSIVSCVLIILVGTLASDWLCFGKSLFFVRLFNVRRRFFPIVLLATADLCLTILIFTVVVGLAIAASAVEFDREVDKHAIFSAAVTPDPWLFSDIHEEAREPKDGNPQTPPEFSAKYDTDVVAINWKYFPTAEAIDWVRYIARLPKQEPAVHWNLWHLCFKGVSRWARENRTRCRSI